MGLRKGDSSRRPSAICPAWLLPTAIVVLSAVLALADEWVGVGLRFDRPAIGAGEFWRLLTAHFVHLGMSHYLLNAVALGLVCYLVGAHFSVSGWLFIGIGSIISIDLGFWLLEPQLIWYVGLSGLLHGVLAAGIVGGINEDRSTVLLLAIALACKLTYEQVAGPLPGSEASSGGSVIVAAHLYGAVGGTLVAAVLAGVTGRARQSH